MDDLQELAWDYMLRMANGEKLVSILQDFAAKIEQERLANENNTEKDG